MKWNEIEVQALEIRNDLLIRMAELAGRQAEWSLAALPSGFKQAQKALGNPEYDVVVCGEVKRGKSSFINALIGQSLLPTGVRETTSQVFRIAGADVESFALVFEDGHREPITREALDRYGSQTTAEQDGAPLFRGRQLRWIEVNTPGVFLPAGVRLVDTPGLGALHAAHSEITNRYILRADAVIFVLDSDQPMTQPEKRFLEKAMAITPNALFIQTKTDTKDESAWQEIQKRNEDLLNTAFGKPERPSIRVYPVSSALLAMAAKEQDKKERAYLVADSQFEKARAALDNVVYRAVGWTRSAWAAAEAARYVHGSLQSLEEQLQVVASESAAEKASLRQRKADIRAGFQKEWGSGGGKRAQFTGEVERVLRGVRQSAQAIGTPGTEMYNRLAADINNLSARSSLEAYANALPEHVRSGVEQEWREIVLSAQKQIAEFDASLSMTPDGLPPFHVDLPRVTVKDPSVWDRIKATNIDGMIGGGLAALVAGFFLTGGIATAVTVAGALLGMGQGYGRITTIQLEGAKNELRQQLNTLLAQCRNALCVPDMAHGKPVALVDAFLETVQAQIGQSLEEQYKSKKAQLEREERRLDEQAVMTGERREVELKTLQERIAQMKQLESQVQARIQDLRKIQTALDQNV